MKYLLDTHILLWFLTGNCDNLSENCQKVLLDETNYLYFSKVSIWEIAIKHKLHPDNLLSSGADVVKVCQEAICGLYP